MFAETEQLFLPFFETKQEMQVVVSGFALLESSSRSLPVPSVPFILLPREGWCAATCLVVEFILSQLIFGCLHLDTRISYFG